MKTSIKSIIGLMLFPAFLFFQGCKDDVLTNLNENHHRKLIPKLDATYPHSKTFKVTRADSFETDWENYETIYSNGKKYYTPWSNNAIGDADFNLATDIKKNNGWTMVLHTLNKDVENSGIFLFFLNKKSGDLKIFYYQEVLPIAHSQAIYEVYCNYPQGWLNGTMDLSLPVIYKFGNQYKFGTTSGNDDQKIKVGWNVFVIPTLAYDPNPAPSQKLQISSNALDIYIGDIVGKIDGVVDGKIITDGSKNPFSNMHNTLTTVTGDNVKKWAENYVLEKGGDSFMSKLLGEGTKGLITLGLNKIFNGLFGSFSQTTSSVQTVKMTMKSNIKSEFNAKKTTISGAINRGFDIGEDITGLKLGVWNLTDNPTVYVHPIGVLSSAPGGIQSDNNTYTFGTSGNYKADVIINPQILPNIKKYWTECEIITYTYHSNDTILKPFASIASYGSLGSYKNGYGLQPIISGTPLYENEYYSMYSNSMSTNIGYYNLWNIYGKNSGPVPVYKYVYGPASNRTARGEFIFNSRANLAKVSLYIITEFEGKMDTTINTRTFVPKFEWDPSLLNSYDNLTMTLIQSKASSDYLLNKFDNGTYDKLRSQVVVK